jgi:hypothetical protein
MKGSALLMLALISFPMITQRGSAMAQTTVSPVHVSNSFQFVVQAPLNRAATLFGPEAERCWAGQHWNPEFLHPQPGKDVQGAVFTVRHGPHKSVWVNTLFDLAGGRMQYVSFVPDTLVFIVDVRLTSLNPSATSVEVTYARTALDATANDEVQALGKSDRGSGPHWQQAIESCLSEHK